MDNPFDPQNTADPGFDVEVTRRLQVQLGVAQMELIAAGVRADMLVAENARLVSAGRDVWDQLAKARAEIARLEDGPEVDEPAG